MMAMRATGAMVLWALGTACQTRDNVSGPAEFPVQLIVANRLVAPISVAIDGTPLVGLQGGAASAVTVSSRAQWLTWTSAKPMDARGQPIPDDIGEVQISVSGTNGVVEIINIINDQAYITASIFNQTPAAVSIGVFDGAAVACAAELPPAAGTVSGFTRIGYYRLRPDTEVRAYRNPGCTGPHVAWPSSHVKAFSAKSGLVLLSLDSAP
jgi:hypothetical protein